MSVLNENKLFVKKQSGFGLVELLVAMALGIVLTAGVVEIYINSKQTFNVQEGMSRLQENSRYAMNRIFKSVSSAGYMGCLSSKATDISAVQTNTLSIQSPEFDFSAPIFGTEGGTLDTLTFKRTEAHQGIPLNQSMVREDDPIELDDTHSAYSSLEQYDVMVIGDCEQVSIFMITNDPQTSGGTIQHNSTTSSSSGQSNTTSWLDQIFKVDDQNASAAMAVSTQVVTYDIRDASNAAVGACSAATPGYCSLFERVNEGNAQELVQGVHGLDVLYGVDTSGDTQADAYQVASAGLDWSAVVSVRVTLSFNSVERVQGGASGTVTSTKNITQVFRLRSRGV